MDISKAKEIIEKFGKTKKKKVLNIKKNLGNLKPSTIENYIEKILFISNKIKNKKLNKEYLIKIYTETFNNKHEEYIIKNLDLDNLDLINFLKNNYKNENTIKSYLIPFTVLCSKIEYYKNGNIHNKLIEYINEINKNYENERDNNSISINDKDKIIINYDIKELTNNLNKLENIEDKLIYALYTFIPPRRLEYSNMLITNNISNNKNNNYLIMENDIPKYFVFNNYKTNKVFGEQKYEIDDNIKELINNYINEKKINLNEYLFNYNANTFGKKITSIFKKLYNENITVRWLRISYTSNIRKQNLTNNELKIISDKMAHSLETNSRYNKINLSYS
jgi:hypothetical protein